MLKRSLDILVSSVLLLVAAPLLALTALIVKLDSEGPALFKQIRVGQGFRPFWLYKIRTMHISSSGSAVTLGHDRRITRCGSWLRKLKIDELPQLWNVLAGEMSLVGPRPVVPVVSREFAPAYARLLRVRPGLTDPASLKYSRETEILARAPVPLHYFKAVVTPDKLRISEEYQRRATVWRDLGVLFCTGIILVFPFLRDRLWPRPATRSDRSNVLAFARKGVLVARDGEASHAPGPPAGTAVQGIWQPIVGQVELSSRNRRKFGMLAIESKLRE